MVTGGFRRSWILLVGHASFLSERETHLCLPIFPTLKRIPAKAGHDRPSMATWFETRGVAALLTMKV
jgi:hypothetical protein